MYTTLFLAVVDYNIKQFDRYVMGKIIQFSQIERVACTLCTSETQSEIINKTLV